MYITAYHSASLSNTCLLVDLDSDGKDVVRKDIESVVTCLMRLIPEEYTVEQVLEYNYSKLMSRKINNSLKGSGDDR